jgi:hypothetical protein
MRLVSGLFALLISAGLALGQGLKTDAPAALGVDKSTAVQWLITAVFVVATLVVAFKPAKRAKLE